MMRILSSTPIVLLLVLHSLHLVICEGWLFEHILIRSSVIIHSPSVSSPSTCYTEQSEQCNTGAPIPVQYVSEDLPIVVLDYNDLSSKLNLSQGIETAFGRSGLGILFVKNVPELSVKRLRLLRLARELAYLDEEIKESLQDEDSLYSIGYSHGKEMLAKDRPVC